MIRYETVIDKRGSLAACSSKNILAADVGSANSAYRRTRYIYITTGGAAWDGTTSERYWDSVNNGNSLCAPTSGHNAHRWPACRSGRPDVGGNEGGLSCKMGWGNAAQTMSGTYWDKGCLAGQRYGITYRNSPVYGYVTRYRTQYYNYITARVSKA